MKILLSISILAFFILSGCAKQTSDPHIRPAQNLIEAIKNGDVSQFASVYTSRIVDIEKGNDDWEGNLKQAQSMLQETLGDWTLDGFSYEYKPESNTVAISYEGKLIAPFKIKEEDGEWKLDER